MVSRFDRIRFDRIFESSTLIISKVIDNDIKEKTREKVSTGKKNEKNETSEQKLAKIFGN